MDEKTHREGSFLSAAKLLDEVPGVGRGRECRAEMQDPRQWKDTSVDAQKAQSHLPAALHPVKQEAALPQTQPALPGQIGALE